jgi:hypothetical protein
MAIIKFTCPPQASAQGSFSDNLVGFQLTNGGGLTQGNFEFTTSVTEKVNRNFNVGTFSTPISLDSLGIENVNQSRAIFEKNFKVYPNFDLTQVTNFVLYGSMTKRMSTSVTKIINYFPAAIESEFLGINYITGATASNIRYSKTSDITTFDLDISRFRNPFDIDFTENSTRNLLLKEMQVSNLRNLTTEFANYSLYYQDNGYPLKGIVPTTSLTNGTLTIKVSGKPFGNNTQIYDKVIIRPNDQVVSRVFADDLDEVEEFLLNRNISPIYTASFKVPKEADNGTYYIATQNITWPLDGAWNLDIRTGQFTNYIATVSEIAESFDSFKTNLISRFLITGAFKDFDTEGQKVEKLLQIYGRSFDETKKFINALAYMNSVHYNVGNDIPSQLLKNLAQTLGWNTDISPITDNEFLSSVFGQTNTTQSAFQGVSASQTPDELNYQYYRNLILNSAFLFKSKGTRKAIEVLMRLIGAPDALVDFNEYVYLADQKIKLSQFNKSFANISGGTYVESTPSLDPTDVFSIFGVQYTGFTTTYTFKDVNFGANEYPIDGEGYPLSPPDTEEYFFQKGSGWFEQTPKHRAPQQPDLTNSVFTGSNPNYQTTLVPYTYGQVYLDKYRNFPFMSLGFDLRPITDNNKSWVDNEVGLRQNLDGNLNARYFVSDDRLVVNVKNVDLFMNPGQGIAYDVWYMSRQYNYPISNQGLGYVAPTRCDPYPINPYPHRGGVDWTEINPQPRRKTFFEFAQTFWQNTINVRNRQYMTNGKSGGYPTLESIYWKYLESNNTVNIPNDNFTYQTMMDYVHGMGDYWIRLVEQMIPATTIWNTGVRYENSIFHRQKFVWRRQEGCQLIPVPCNPCTLEADFYPDDCQLQTAECSQFPWNSNPEIQSFQGILNNILTSYLTSNGYVQNDCLLDSLNTNWYVDIKLENSPLVQYSFFEGVGYNIAGVSYPTNDIWVTGLNGALESLENFGYGYYLTTENTVVVYNNICSLNSEGITLELSVGINFQIYCS